MITQDELRDVLRYDYATGEFTWLKCGAAKCVGKRAGSTNDSGYTTIMYNGRNYRAHRLAWIYHYGEDPKHPLDHINGVRNDNRIENLRTDPNGHNSQNMHGAKKSSKSGIAGVHWVAHATKWRAQICIDGKSRHLGYFPTETEAKGAYVKAKQEHHEFYRVSEVPQDRSYATIGRYNNDKSVQSVKE